MCLYRSHQLSQLNRSQHSFVKLENASIELDYPLSGFRITIRGLILFR
jgi:hypothetical protein